MTWKPEREGEGEGVRVFSLIQRGAVTARKEKSRERTRLGKEKRVHSSNFNME